ncbi:EamA family transporter [Escherichia coli]|nr:EamA family transporter [Escherichia coli]HDI9530589.1 EamA family transporter [Escherichia coli]
MGSTRKGMLNVLIAAVLWGSSGVCAQYIMEQSQMSSQFLTMTRLIFAGLILLTLSFVHGDKIFSIINNHKDAISLLIFSVVGALTVQLTFLLTIEKSNAATATVLQFLSPTIIVGWSMLIGGLILLPFYARQGTNFVVNGSLILAFFYLIVIGTSLTFSLYLKGAQLIGGPKASILSCAEPLSSALLSLLLLGITFTLPDWLGTLLILSSVILISMDSRRRARKINRPARHE